MILIVLKKISLAELLKLELLHDNLLNYSTDLKLE